MRNKYGALRQMASTFRNHPDFKSRIACCIFRWAKDDTLELREFAFLVKKALNYLKPLNEQYITK